MGSEPLRLMIDAEWLSPYGVGANEIDAEHEMLFDRLSAVRHAFAAANYGTSRDLLQDLVDAVEAHFAHEEDVFGTMDYPGAGRHVAQHALLKHRLNSIARSAGDADLPPHALADLIDAAAAVLMTDHLTLDLELKQLPQAA